MDARHRLFEAAAGVGLVGRPPDRLHAGRHSRGPHAGRQAVWAGRAADPLRYDREHALRGRHGDPVSSAHNVTRANDFRALAALLRNFFSFFRQAGEGVGGPGRRSDPGTGGGDGSRSGSGSPRPAGALAAMTPRRASAPPGAAPPFRFALRGGQNQQKRNESFAKRNQRFREACCKSLKSLGREIRHFAISFIFNALAAISFRPFSRGRAPARRSTPLGRPVDGRIAPGLAAERPDMGALSPFAHHSRPFLEKGIYLFHF